MIISGNSKEGATILMKSESNSIKKSDALETTANLMRIIHEDVLQSLHKMEVFFGEEKKIT